MDETARTTLEMATTAVLAPSNPPKPKYSEKRKQQNRAAQKTYREKRKQRLARVRELEELASSAGLWPVSTCTPGGDSASSLSHAEAPKEPEKANPSTGTEQSNYAATSPLGSLSPGSASWFDNLDFMQDFSLPSLETTILDIDQAASALPEPNIFPVMPDPASSWQLTCTRPTFSVQYVDRSHVNVKWIRSVVTRNAKTNPDLERFSTTFPPFSSWNPYTNNLTLTTLNFITACFANCVYLGVSPDHLCSDDACSPFYRPLIISSGLPDDNDAELTDVLVTQTQSSFANIKPDLRPTRMQVLVKHEPWIDVLPFPTLRDALIRGIVAAMQKQDGSEEEVVNWKERRTPLSDDMPICEFDTEIEAEFWRDVVNNDGLVCWGSVGGRDDEGREGGGTGSPWDGRSWEARKWFLEKWGDLLGESGGELGAASSWWRGFRGEDLPGRERMGT